MWQAPRGLSLGAGAQHHDAVLGILVDVEGVDDVLLVDLKVSELTGDPRVGDHRASGHDHFAPSLDGGVANLLETVDVA